MLAIELLELTRDYHSFRAVNKISFGIEKGIVFGLLGPNGAGKSTIIKMLTTLLLPTSGTAKIDGYDIRQSPGIVRQVIGYVPQLVSADEELTGYENLMLAAKLYGFDSHTRKQRVQELLKFMGLSDVANQLVSHYSGGMVRRLEIAQALVHQPRIIFFDEPTVSLDPAARQAVWQYIQGWQKQYNATILLTTHDMEEADKLCDIVAFMHHGHLMMMDTPAALKASLGSKATLDDVFIKCTGSSLKENGEYANATQTRRTISRRH
jgi:ABC-2 type transport system ATP-binding protein